jgi:streptomycin 6-kinase
VSELDDEDAITRTAAQVMQKLWKPAPTTHNFTTLTRWANGLNQLRNLFNGGYGPFPPALVDRAQGLFRELLSGDVEHTLIHGDLHTGNILLSARGWLTIDPKGVVGLPLYDAGNFVNDLDPLGDAAAERHATLRRASVLAETLGVDRREILTWAVAHAVLSGWWSYEDHGAGWEWAFTRAAHAAHLLDRN